MISIIIPTLNEKTFIRQTILNARTMAASPEQLGILVVDAGSKDGTLGCISDLTVRAFHKPEFLFRKYASLNFGVTQSKGDCILFLDADTQLPRGFDMQIENSLKQIELVAGAFEFSFKAPDLKLRILTALNRIRYRLGKVFYGDQAVFVKRKALESIGGVPQEPLMETAFLCKRLRSEGKMILIKPGIVTSPRRFLDQGFFKVAWFDLNMFIRFNLGLSVSGFAKKYWSKNLNQ